MPRRAGGHGLPACNSLLGEAGQAVILGAEPDDRLTVAIGGRKGRGHAGNAHINGNAMFLQDIREHFGRFELPQPKFRVVKEKLGTRVEFRFAPVDPFLDEVFDEQTFQERSPIGFDGTRRIKNVFYDSVKNKSV
jgi:hypothetical protein